MILGIPDLFLLAILFLLLLAMAFDFTKREIPNLIPFLIWNCGMILAVTHGFWIQALAGTAALVLIIILLNQLQLIGGGDLKLIAALGASLTFSAAWNLNIIAWILFIGAAFLLIGLIIAYCWASGKEFKGLPLAPCVAAAWILIKIATLLAF